MKLWLTLASITRAYNPFGFAPQPTGAPSKTLNLQELYAGVFASSRIRDIQEGKNFCPANEGNGLLPMGLRCQRPTPRSKLWSYPRPKTRPWSYLQYQYGQSTSENDVVGRIVNGAEASFNWPFIVRLKVDGYLQQRARKQFVHD